MRTLFKILFLSLICFSAKAQSPHGFPSPNNPTGYYNIGWLRSDSGSIVGQNAPTFTPLFYGTEITYLNPGVDTSLWVWVGRWVKELKTGDAGTFIGVSPIVVNGDSISCPTCGSGSGGINQLNGDGLAGPGSGLQTFTLATVNTNVGSFGDASHVADFTVNGKGLLTAAGQIAIQISESQVTNLATDLAGKQSIITQGSTAQYFRGDFSLATFPTNLSAFTNGPGYITGITGISAGGDLTGTYPNPTLAAKITAGTCTNCALTYNAAGQITVASSGSGGGAITGGGGLTPLFTNGISGSTMTFILSNAAANSVFGNPTGSTGAPSYFVPSISNLNTWASGSIGLLGVANTWGPLQTFGTITTTGTTIFSGLTSSGANDSVLTVDPSTGQVHRRSGTLNLFAGNLMTATGVDTLNAGGTALNNTTFAMGAFSLSITGLPNKSTALSTDSVPLIDLSGKLWKLPVPSGGGGGISQIFSKNAPISISGTDTVKMDTLVYQHIFNVLDAPFNADPTFTVDAGAAIQAAILADSACGGCGIVYIPNGHYKISKAFDNNCNCQIRIPATNPYITAFDPVIKIYGQSVSTVGAEGYSVTLTPLPTNGVILQSTIAGTGSIPCVFGTYFNPHTFQYTDIEMKDFNVRGFTNGGTAPITSTYFNLKFSATFKLDRIIGCADTINQKTVDPSTTEVAGLMAGNFDDNGPNSVSNCIMTGVKYGFIIGEHTELHNDYAIADDYGLTCGAVAYPLTGRFLTHACKHALLIASTTIFGDYLGSGGAALDLDWDQEEDIAGFWYDYVNDLVDSSNRSYGTIRLFAADSTGTAPMRNFGCARLNIQKPDSAYQTSSFKVINNGGNNTATGFSNGIVSQGLDSTKYGEFQLLNNKGFKSVFQLGGSSSASGASYANTLAIVNLATSGNILLGTTSAAIAERIFNNGNVIIGPAADNTFAALQLPTGTTTLAPLSLPPGTLVATPHSGNFENNGTNLFFTIGSTRLQLTNQSGVPGGTNGAIQFNLLGATLGGNSSLFSYNTAAGSTGGYIGLGIATSAAPLEINRPFVAGRGQFSIQDSSNAGSASTAFMSFYDNTNTRIGLIGYPAYTANDSNMNISNYQTNGGVWLRNQSTILAKFNSAGTLIMPTMATGGTAPVTSGTTKCVIVDANGLYSFTSCSGGGGGLAPGGPTNSLQINNGSTGNLSGFSALQWDSVNSRLGIGGVPSAPLEINSAIVSTRGQVSIEDAAHSGVNSLAYISMFGSNNTRIGLFGFGQYGGSSDPNYYEVNENGGTIAWRNSSATIGQFTNAGLFGIGSTTPLVSFHDIGAVNGAVEGRIENTTAGTGAFTRWGLRNDAAKSLLFTEISSAFTPSGLITASSAQIFNNGAGGLLVATSSAPLQFSVDGEVSVAAELLSSKNFLIGSTTDNNAFLQIGANTTTNASMFFNGAAVDVTSPTNGMLRYITTGTHHLYFRDGGADVDLLLAGGGSTPTLQQVLTAGSTLTANNTITNTAHVLTESGGILNTTGGFYNSAQGSEFLGSASTINNAVTAASGTVSDFSAYAFLAPTITSTNASITYTTPATVRIDNSPTLSTNSTASVAYALDVAAGQTHMGVGGSNVSIITDGGAYLNGASITNTNGVALGASTTTQAALNFNTGVDPTGSVLTHPGNSWFNGTNYYFVNASGAKIDLLKGIKNYEHNISTPSTGGTVNLVTGQYNIINPSGALATLTVNLPSSPLNNDVVYIKYTQTITAVTYGNGTVVDGITAPSAGGLVVLTFDTGTTSWY